MLILVSMVCARTCAMSFNRLVDRRFDALNPRTAGRHLPAGKISLASAIALCGLSAAGLVAASYFLNPLCFYLSPVALVIVCFYSLTKRFTDFTHFFLGLALAVAPVGAWLAVTGSFAWPAIVLAFAVVFWLAGFDVIYATLDEDFDRAEGLYSLPVKLGRRGALKVSSLLHGAAFLCLAALYFTSMAGELAAFLLLCAGLLFFLEHMFAEKVDFAFFRINVMAGFVVLLMVWAGVQKEF